MQALRPRVLALIIPRETRLPVAKAYMPPFAPLPPVELAPSYAAPPPWAPPGGGPPPLYHVAYATSHLPTWGAGHAAAPLPRPPDPSRLTRSQTWVPMPRVHPSERDVAA